MDAVEAMAAEETQAVTTVTEPQSATTVVAAATAPNIFDEDTWIIDSGCSQHISFAKELFEDLHPCGGIVTIANNATAQVEGAGTAKLHAKDSEGKLQ
ncbi:hypothetical protein PR003_g14467 [Phytophthora rubi]|uniref:Retrovirus-related Pol polyprotein from transposon TNT 1-94-like beta-barrel domain-containing protein n=1 Tax=Phytophthora rubi TaxID=129364 RepID=A0A6A3LBI8_9STRA|nr:hypothetical protein PR002_g13565 [Phytophthora rubi]KAE9332537.1 hypothetical protein PR003_g14467 [Phytophthora rubi]